MQPNVFCVSRSRGVDLGALGLVLASFLGASACGDDKGGAPDTTDTSADTAGEVTGDGETSEPGETGEADELGDAETTAPPAAVVRFDLPASGLPAPLAIPFPSDLYRTGPDLTGPVTDTLANWEVAGITEQATVMRLAYAGLDGFGHTSGALFRLDVAGGEGAARAIPELDVTTLPATGAACLADNSPVALLDVTDPVATRVPCIASYYAPLGVLVVIPEGTSLHGGRRYAAVVSDRLVTTTGGRVGAATAFAELLHAPRATPAATLFGTAADRVAAALPSWSADHVAGMAVYSAHTEHRKLRGIRDALVHGDYGAPPQLITDPAATAPYAGLRFCATAKPGCAATLAEWLGVPRKDADGHDLPGAPGEPGHPEPAATGWPQDALGVVVQGAFNAPEFRRAWSGGADPNDGTIAFVDGAAVATGDLVKVPVTIILPRTAPPETGYPVVIFAHGTPSNRQFVMTIANELARAGIATVAMDGLYHGVRTGDGSDKANNYPGTYVGPDGFSDSASTPLSTIDLSASLMSAARYRANLWQFGLEWCQLRRLVANPALDLSIAADQYPAGTALHLDATRVGWVGTSFGAFTGAALLSVEPGIRAFFLNAGNGDGLEWQGQSPANRSQIEIILVLFGMDSATPLTRFNPFVNIAFGALEPGFAAAAAEDVDPAGPDILMTEIEFDEYVPNRSTETLAAALGVPQVVPAARTIPLLASTASPVTGSAGHPARGLVHMGSASHSSNLGRRWSTREFGFPAQLIDSERQPFPVIAPPLWVRQPVVATQAMMVHFLKSAFDGAAAIDSSAIPRVIDFDDDGWCDTTERAAGTAWDDPTVHPEGAPDCLWDPKF